MHIHFSWLPNPQIKQVLEDSLLPGHQLSFEGNTPETTEILVDGRPSSELLQTLPSIHSLVIPFAGLPEVTRRTLLKRNHCKQDYFTKLASCKPIGPNLRNSSPVKGICN